LPGGPPYPCRWFPRNEIRTLDDNGQIGRMDRACPGTLSAIPRILALGSDHFDGALLWHRTPAGGGFQLCAGSRANASGHPAGTVPPTAEQVLGEFRRAARPAAAGGRGHELQLHRGSSGPESAFLSPGEGTLEILWLLLLGGLGACLWIGPTRAL